MNKSNKLNSDFKGIMEGLERLLQTAGMGAAPPGQDVPIADTAEMVYISSLALLKVRPN